jgi:hypothetical protein
VLGRGRLAPDDAQRLVEHWLGNSGRRASQQALQVQALVMGKTA